MKCSNKNCCICMHLFFILIQDLNCESVSPNICTEFVELEKVNETVNDDSKNE